MTQESISENADAARRVTLGCRLGYVAQRSTPALLKLQPYPDLLRHIVLEEKLISSSNPPTEHVTDVHGNRTLRMELPAGYNEFHYEATLILLDSTPAQALSSGSGGPGSLPLDVLRYTFPSRYCESDKLFALALEKFGGIQSGLAQAQAICDWVHANLEYRYGSGVSTLSALDALQRGYGVCRDFSHVMIALCRALDLPARYVAGYVPLMPGNEVEGDNDIGVDFHAYVEVYVGGSWHAFDARYNQPFKGRIKIAHGMDAVDAAFATFFGNVETMHFKVWAKEVPASPDYSLQKAAVNVTA
jgi:transglutaminase-like putative cysteine protease